MAATGITGSIASGELTAALRAMAQAAGIPSYDEVDDVEILNVFNGRWAAGLPTTDFAQLSFFCEQDGLIGDGEGSAQVSLVGAAYSGSGTREITLAGAFEGWDWYDGAYLKLDDSAPGTGWTAAERYLIASKTDDDTVVLENLDSIDNAVPMPAGANADTKATVSTRQWASIQVPVPAPVGPPASNPNHAWPAVDLAVPPQSSFWSYPVACLPPGGLTNGAEVRIVLRGRIRVRNVAQRGGEAIVYLIVDPGGSPLVQDNRRNSGQVGRVRPARVGWSPGAFDEESVPYAEGTLSDLGGTMLVTLPLHSLQSGDLVHLLSAPIDEDENTGDIADIEEGQAYYVCLADVDAGIVDPANSFTLSKVPPTDKYVPVGYSVTGDVGKVAVGRGSFGSMRRVVWPFKFTAAEETENDDYQFFTAVITGSADGTTSNGTDGVIWTGELTVHRTAEVATWAANNVQNPIAAGTADVRMSGAIPRTRPGNSMNTAGSGTESMVGAPLFRLKTKVYTDGTAVDHHAYATTQTDFEGSWDEVEIDQKLHNEAHFTGGAIVVDAGAYNATNRTIQQAAKFTTYTFTNGDKWRWTEGDGVTPGYYEIEAKEANNRIRLKPDPRLPLANNANSKGDIDEFPLISYLGEESGAAQVGELATATAVFRADGTYLGDVAHHDNLRRRIWIKRAKDGEYALPDEDLTLRTYRREKEGGTGAWGFHSSTPIREYTVRAGRVNRGRQKIPLHLRIAVGGPPNGDVVLEVRTGVALLTRHRSR
jgi:hypothetical protein